MACYLLDTNFFIQNFKDAYPPDVFPGFWTKVLDLANEGSIRSIDKVLIELKRKDDEVSRWVKNNLTGSFFYSTSHPDLFPNYIKVINWANNNPRFSGAEKRKFLENDYADPWLVATAMTDPQYFSIITHEAAAPFSKRIKLPDVCSYFGIKSLNTIQLFRELQTSV